MQTGPELSVEDLKQQVEEGRAVQETLASDGWKIFEEEMKKKILEMRTMQTYPDNLRKMQAQYQASNALQDVLSFCYDMVRAKDSAEKALSKIPRR